MMDSASNGTTTSCIVLQESATYLQEFSWLSGEEATEGNSVGEAELPEASVQTSNTYCSPTYSQYNTQAMSTEGSTSSSYTGSLDYPDYTYKDTTDDPDVFNRSFGFQADYIPGNGYHGDNGVENEDSDSVGDNSSSRVLRQLDQIMRKKINLEVQEFHSSLHGVLDGQMDSIAHLFHLSQLGEQNKSLCPSDGGTVTRSRDYGVTDKDDAGEKTKAKITDTSHLETEVSIYESLTSLFVSVGKITNSLRKKEFSL